MRLRIRERSWNHAIVDWIQRIAAGAVDRFRIGDGNWYDFAEKGHLDSQLGDTAALLCCFWTVADSDRTDFLSRKRSKAMLFAIGSPNIALLQDIVGAGLIEMRQFDDIEGWNFPFPGFIGAVYALVNAQISNNLFLYIITVFP